MNTQSLLIELGTEELPPKALAGLAGAFFDGVAAGLQKRGVAFAQTSVQALYSPRRLAVRINGVALEQAAQKSEVFGPYVNIALDANGEPTPALHGFAQKNGLAIDALQKITDAKGERFVARSERAGSLTVDLLPEVVNEAIKALPIPKPMRWGNREEQFVRPVHWLLALLGQAVVPMTVLGLKAGRQSRGHRFHAPVCLILPVLKAMWMRCAQTMCWWMLMNAKQKSRSNCMPLPHQFPCRRCCRKICWMK